MDNGPNPYDERRASVHALGFASYELYLDSQLWDAIRRQVLPAACVRCAVRAATNVHHAAYDLETLAGRRTDTLLPACRRCHRLAEGYGRHEAGAADRLAVATLFLLGGLEPRRRRKKGRSQHVTPGAPATWRALRRLRSDPDPSRRALKVQAWTKRHHNATFSAAPRLVKKAG